MCSLIPQQDGLSEPDLRYSTLKVFSPLACPTFQLTGSRSERSMIQALFFPPQIHHISGEEVTSALSLSVPYRPGRSGDSFPKQPMPIQYQQTASLNPRTEADNASH